MMSHVHQIFIRFLAPNTHDDCFSKRGKEISTFVEVGKLLEGSCKGSTWKSGAQGASL